MADEWRYPQEAGTPPWPDAGGQAPADADLWGEDPSESWTQPGAWALPRPPAERTGEQSTVDSGGWARHADVDWGQHPGADRAHHRAADQPAPTSLDGPLPPPPVPPPVPGQPDTGHRDPWDGVRLDASGRVDRDPQPGPGGTRNGRTPPRRGFDLGPTRRAAPSTPDHELDEPSYVRVLAFTSYWYAIPLALYLAWLILLADDRRGIAGQQLAASLPWLLVAGALSFGCALGLRRSTVGWRALGLSFAAAAIGAGLATLGHSLLS